MCEELHLFVWMSLQCPDPTCRCLPGCTHQGPTIEALSPDRRIAIYRWHSEMYFINRKSRYCYINFVPYDISTWATDRLKALTSDPVYWCKYAPPCVYELICFGKTGLPCIINTMRAEVLEKHRPNASKYTNFVRVEYLAQRLHLFSLSRTDNNCIHTVE